MSAGSKYPPCENPQCKSYGKPHPNCRCYMAKGGSVCASMMPHESGCQYFTQGGLINEMPPAPPPAHPAVTVGHAAVHHGLLGLLKDVGNKSLAEPDKHRKKIEKVRGHLMNQNHEKAINELHGSPLAGPASLNHLEPIVHRLAPAVLSREPNPEALRGSVDYLSSAIKGNESLENHLGTFFESQKTKDALKPDETSREGLDKVLLQARENPSSLLDIGGSLGHYLPEHAVQLGATAANAVSYLNGIRPTSSRENPLDEETPIDKNSQANFKRQLDIAQKPMLALQHVRSGTLLPKDVQTVQVLYPELYKSMTEKMTNSLVDAQTKKKHIPYRQRIAMSMFLGQPMDSTMTPDAMQAIIQSQSEQQIQNQSSGAPKKSQGKPSSAVLKQLDKVDRMYATPEERRQIDEK